ncbi:9174_t:CDS:2 [Ambispora gerdemannii]|uniref:9174_t:CDS:1 n=1 Tax=Ambispora gerdemannii TaxID=144530 RepID=A0A9N8WP22_9GLOM|nr:9174_t:CDS:2 [Ambispora gerdemannii]
MWNCLYKTCPCLPRRGDTQPPFNHFSYDDDDDNFEFGSLLADQDRESISAFLTRSPFQRAPNTNGYLRVNTMSPDDDISGAASDRGSVLLDDEATIQTQDAQYLPDEQISKLTELISEQVIDAQLAAEEDQARRQEEEEIKRNRQAGMQAAMAQGLIPPNGENGHNKDTYFTIADDDDEVETNEFGNPSGTTFQGKKYNDYSTTSLELSSTNISNSSTNQNGSITTITTNTSTTPTSLKSEEISILNKPRNPHQRLFSSEIVTEDYEDVDENISSSTADLAGNSSGSSAVRYPSKRSMIRHHQQKMEDYSPFSTSILNPDEYESENEDNNIDSGSNNDSPILGDDEIDHPLLHIIPDLSDTVGSFLSGFTKLRGFNNSSYNNNESDQEEGGNSLEDLSRK